MTMTKPTFLGKNYNIVGARHHAEFYTHIISILKEALEVAINMRILQTGQLLREGDSLA